MRVDIPADAGARPSPAVTVVLPTPPFPATMTRRDAAKNCAGSTVNPSRGERAQVIQRLCPPRHPRAGARRVDGTGDSAGRTAHIAPGRTRRRGAGERLPRPDP